MNKETGFSGIKLLDIDSLRLSQIYLSEEKIASITKWFHPEHMERFSPLAVHDFGNGMYTIVDGHSRAYVAYKSGVSRLPALYDNNDIVTGRIGQMLYHADIDWCERFGLTHISRLGDRILNRRLYQKLWVERCDRSYDLLTQTSHNERIQLQKSAPGLFLYGASEDRSTLFFENESGELFLYENGSVRPEKFK